MRVHIVRRMLAIGLCLATLGFAGLPAAHTYAYPYNPLPTQPGFEGGKSFSGLSAWYGSPTLADINKDGKQEIIFGGTDGMIYAVSSSGTLLWQVNGAAAINAVALHPSAIRVESAPAVADVDGDGWPEIAVSLDPGAGVSNANGGVILLRHDGTIMPGWPKLGADHFRQGYSDGFWSSPALGDVDGDGKLEIVAGGWDMQVHIWRYDGTELPGWPRVAFDTVWSSPALADLNRDGKLEIVIGTDAADGGYLHAYRVDGTDLPGFPKHIDQTIYSSPAVADLNGDGSLDIVVGTGNFYSGRGYAVYAWDASGNPLPGWPVATGSYVMSSPSVGDIDGDGKPEVVVGANDGKLYAFHGNGSTVAGWPVLIKETSVGLNSPLFYASPVLANFDGDPYPEVYINQYCDTVVLDGNGRYLTQEGASNTGKPSMYIANSYCQSNTPAVSDIDGDGKLEVVRIAGTTSQSNGNAQVYVWQTQHAPTTSEWSMFRRSSDHQAIYKGAPTLDARLVSQDLPAIMQPGETRTIHLTMENTGSTSWTRSTLIRLGSGGDDGFWTNARIELGSSETIAPGQQKAFTFQLTAPATPGYYYTFWRMVKEGVTPFGLAAFQTVKVGNQPALYVLSKVKNASTGGVYAGGIARGIAPPVNYHGYWNAARSMAFLDSGLGYQLLDSEGAIWQAGMAQPMGGANPVQSSSARQILYKRSSSAFYVLDAYGNLQNSFGASAFSPATPTFGDQRIRAFALTPDEKGVYVLSGDGTIYRGGSAPLLSPSTPNFGADIAKRIKVTKSGTGYYVLDAYGRLWNGGSAPAMTASYGFHVGEDWARDFALTGDEKGFYMLDKEGGIHVGGTAIPLTVNVPPTWPGQDVAVELAVIDSRVTTGVQVAVQNLSFLCLPNQTHTAALNLTSAGGAASWNAASDSTDWLIVSPSSGTTPSALVISVKPKSTGNVTGHVTINSSANSTPIVVTVAVKTVSHLNYVYLPFARR
jgi:hypothetical protein